MQYAPLLLLVSIVLPGYLVYAGKMTVQEFLMATTALIVAVMTQLRKK